MTTTSSSEARVVDESMVKEERKHEVSTLRVALSELTSGNTSGRVFWRPSLGAAAIRVDRTEAHTKVTKALRTALLEEDHNNTSH